ncbi:ComF family protein [Nakamurella multipartita]|uniref:Phosphoribosyltransferase n=1 Tax=Nakamurella multipartita (strain ATCC 700099 / DSM 44233 / CIP 104796 / JCM 9543 / NBRC 105858 / Y-104) TaxID=479431 RepID=C8XEA9_NAKMY|nr:phosphoribosyltransferase [Nakamurella multipartita]ACV77767.1 phosphoribosyltransferase [Nakamurella multipartita DSM 44233]
MGERAGPVELLDALADLVLPRPCPGCGRAGPWCVNCARTVGRAPRRIRPPDDPAAAAGLPPAWALAHYTGPIRAAVLAGKEKGRRDLPPRLGQALGAGVLQLLAWGAVLEPVWLVPAPSRPSAARRRGGDPVRAMATAAARTVAAAGRACGVAPCLVTAGRARDSVGLDADARRRNLSGRIRLRPGGAPPPGADVLLLDDVLTTGATAVAAAAALTAAGHRPVGLLTLAAVPRSVSGR